MRDSIFKNSRIKIQQACRHILEVKKLLDQHSKSLVFIPGIPPEMDISEYEGKIVIPLGTMNYRSPPEIVPATIGDAIHNLRSSLDLMAADLARSNGETRSKVSFPFGEDKEKFQKERRSKNFHKCGQLANDTIDKIAPYRGGNDLLYAIHSLDISDKHDILLPISNSIGSPVIDTWTGKIVGDPTLPSSVTYAWPEGNPLRGQDVMASLDNMAELITDVVDAFEPTASIPTCSSQTAGGDKK